MERRTRKQRFSPKELKTLLTRIAEHKEIITNKQLNEFVVQKKKIIWDAITEDVNNADDYAPQRTIGDVKKKWNDMKSAVHRYRLQLRKRGATGQLKCIPPGYVGAGHPVPPPREPAFYDAIMDIIRDDPYTLMNGNGGVVPLRDESGLEMNVEALDENSEDSDGTASLAEQRLSVEVKREKQSPVNSTHDNSPTSEDELLTISIASTLNSNSFTSVISSISTTASTNTATTTNTIIAATVSTVTETTKTLSQQSRSVSNSIKPPFTSVIPLKSTVASVTPLFTHSQPSHQRISSIVLQPTIQVSTSPTFTHIPLHNVVLPHGASLPNISHLSHGNASHPINVQCPPSQLQFKKHMKRKADKSLSDETLWNAYLESKIELNAEKIKLKKVKQEYYLKKLEILDTASPTKA